MSAFPNATFVFASPLAGVDYTPPVTGEGKLKELREDRRVARLLRTVSEGTWRDLLEKISQHSFPLIQNAAGKLTRLIVKLNLIGAAMELHAETLAGERSNVATSDGYDDQQESVNAIAARSNWNAQLLIAAELMNIEGAAFLRSGVEATSSGRGVVIVVEDNEVCFPVGRIGANLQPTAYERRWVVEVPDPADPKKKINVLRVESHWLPDGSPVAAIAQRAYIVESGDPLGTCVTDKGVRPYDVTKLPGAPADVLTLLPTADLDIVQVVIGRRAAGGSVNAKPRSRFRVSDLDLLDSATMILSGLVNTISMHAQPILVVPESALDKKTSKLPKNQKVFAHSDDGKPEYVAYEAKFVEVLDVAERFADYALASSRASRVVLGMPAKGTVTTLGELRMNAQPTLSAARTTATYTEPMLEQAWTVATIMDSRMPGNGFDCGRVSVRLKPGLFATFDDRVDSAAKALAAGVTSEWHAVASVHGEDQADAVIAQMERERAAKADLAAKSLMLDMSASGGGSAVGGAGPSKDKPANDPSKSDAAEGTGGAA